MSKEYGPLICGKWSANHFESILMQLKEGNTFVLQSNLSSPDYNWSIQWISIKYRARDRLSDSKYSYVWVTNDERRRIIKVLNSIRLKNPC